MRWVLFGALIFLNISCATLSNRRDLYRPNQEDEPPVLMHSGTVRTTTTTTRTTRTATPIVEPPSGPITPDDEPVLPP